MGEGGRSGDTKLSTEGKLIERLIIIMLKGGCGEDGGGGEKINITRLYQRRRGEIEEEI